MIGTTDTDRSGQTFTRVAVKLGSGKVHYARKYDGWGVSPQCGGNRASERYRVVNQDVDCKRCLKLLAAEEAAERAHRDRVDASMQPATGECDYLPPAAESVAQQPEAQRAGRMQVTNPPLTAKPKSATSSADAEAEPSDTAREKILSQLAEIDARLSRIETRLAELLPSTRAVPTEPQATEVRVVMDSDSVGSAWLNGTEYAVFRGFSSWGVVGTGIRGTSLDGIGKALARRLGIDGPVTVAVVPPQD